MVRGKSPVIYGRNGTKLIFRLLMKQSPRDMFNVQGPKIELVNEHRMRHRSARAERSSGSSMIVPR